ncbi:MAG: septum formation protein Maf, partial [Bacteroidota bacterium]
ACRDFFFIFILFIYSIIMHEIILASGSPRRKELLEDINPNFEVIVRNVDENFPSDLPSENVAEFLAILKADAYKDLIMNTKKIVITADTVVVFDNKILGKPKSNQDAIEMLSLLSGKMHEVITGVCVMAEHKKISFSEVSKVYFDNLPKETIEYYIHNFKPLDKAGAYGVQEYIGRIGIKKIEGCFYNIMGLPVNKLWNELLNF